LGQSIEVKVHRSDPSSREIHRILSRNIRSGTKRAHAGSRQNSGPKVSIVFDLDGRVADSRQHLGRNPIASGLVGEHDNRNGSSPLESQRAPALLHIAEAKPRAARADVPHSASSSPAAPETPIPPMTTPFSTIGSPPCHVINRDRLAIPIESSAEADMRAKKAGVDFPLMAAVKALSAAKSMTLGATPSIRPIETPSPDGSQIATQTRQPLLSACEIAAVTSRLAAA
jgi:hypothetical protein